MSKYKPGKFFTGEPCKNGHVAERWNYNGMCVVCKRETDKRSNLKASKKYRIKKEYGLTMEQVDRIRQIQDNKCAICTTEFPDKYKVQIDHCHTTGKVRGLLCIECNWMLGKAKDDPVILTNAIEYLNETSEAECLSNL
jgi:hypothetical protein